MSAADKHLIQRLVQHTGLSATQLAVRAGLTPSTLTRPLHQPVKHRLSSPTMDKLKVAVPDFLDWRGEHVVPDAVPGSASKEASEATTSAEVVARLDLVPIQSIDLEYGLGASFADQHVDVEVQHFPRAWVQTLTHSPPAMLTFARGRGESMAPTIHSNDMVMIDRSQRVIQEPDAIWAHTIGDFGAIKRLRVRGERVTILSDNPVVPPDEAHISELNIVGRVIAIIRSI